MFAAFICYGDPVEVTSDEPMPFTQFVGRYTTFTSTRLTVLKDGIYQISINIYNGITDAPYTAYIRKNGVPLVGQYYAAVPGGLNGYNLWGRTMVAAFAGDYFELVTNGLSGLLGNVDSVAYWISIIQVA
jgi:hypothetical protein